MTRNQATSMTRDQAISEAEKRWGDDALAIEISSGHFAVGTFFNKTDRHVYGHGTSYKEAFTCADENGGRPLNA